jgi:cephalosporin-C deacetylase-like acetyl esterase
MQPRARYCLLAVLFLSLPYAIHADEADLVAMLRGLDATVVAPDSEQAKELPKMLAQDQRRRLGAAAERENEAWLKVQRRDDWERFRDARLQALRAALGQLPSPRNLKLRLTRTLEGPGYRVGNLIYETRPGLIVTANLYRPSAPVRSMPGILIVHSHHNPRTQGELQDMGMTWARLGCAVLIPDQLGHGERRQHPFRDAASFPEPFKVDRQDYYFRYQSGVQLHLVGESLIGWLVHDLRCGLDVLCALPGIDQQRILLLGAVAGGGDPAAVTAALDPRVTAVAPFNFGGQQLGTGEIASSPFSGASWESTRNLRLSARDGFAPWVIVGAMAPRRLVFAHEFAWDEQRDPAWPKLQKIFALSGADANLAATAGKGNVRGTPPESTHCNNIGPYHRSKLYPILKRWLDLPIPEKEFVGQRRTAAELAALSAEIVKEYQPRLVHDLAGDLADQRLATARQQLAKLRPEERVGRLRKDWERILGDVEPNGQVTVKEYVKAEARQRLDTITAFRIPLEPERGITIPLLLLVPPHSDRKPPVVVAFAQEGKQLLLKQRAESIAALLAHGVAVCLPDLRGTGETHPGDGRRYQSTATALSATEQLLGQTLLGARLRDLRSVLRYLRSCSELDASRLALWGDSLAPLNPRGQNVEVPPDIAKQPEQAEPLGGLLALLGALFEDDVRAVYVQGGLDAYRSVLRSPFLYVPHDALPPGTLTASDLCDIAAALAPRPLRLEGLVDGLNRRVEDAALARTFAPARATYEAAGAAKHLHLAAEAEAVAAARWLLQQVRSGS